MQLLIKNLGRIKSAEIGLRPLTVFIGENNTNKTWTAHALFGLLEGLRVQSPHIASGWRESDSLARILDEQASQWLDQLSEGEPSKRGAFPQQIQLQIGREELLSRLKTGDAVIRIGHPIWSSLLGVDASDWATAELAFDQEDLDAGFFTQLSVQYERNSTVCTLIYEWKDNTLRPLVNMHFVGNVCDFKDILRRALLSLMLAAHNDVRVLPSERHLISYLYKDLRRRTDKDLSVTRVLNDFANLMISFKSCGSDNYSDLADALHRLLGGKVVLPTETEPISFQPDGTRVSTIALKSASSLVKSLTGLAVFLQNAKPGDMVIIDEPEMNAHPNTQMALVELFAMMVNRGIRMVLATHSPYIVDHLTNLVEASVLHQSKRKDIAAALALRSEAAFLSADKLAVHWFIPDGDEVKVKSVFEPIERDIDWSTFSNQTDRSSALYSRILDASST